MDMRERLESRLREDAQRSGKHEWYWRLGTLAIAVLAMAGTVCNAYVNLSKQAVPPVVNVVTPSAT